MYKYYGNEFIQMMKDNIPGICKPAGNNKEVVCRCPYCGDSKDPTHAHLYISVPMGPEDLSMYHCKKCPAHGVVTADLLMQLGCYNGNTLTSIASHNNNAMKSTKYRFIKDTDIYNLIYPNIRLNNNVDIVKCKYINSRIGSTLSPEEMRDLKIITSLKDVISVNNLRLTRDRDVVNKLSSNFIGFGSYDNSFVTMRMLYSDGLYGSINKRYIVYELVNKMNDSKSFYVIPGYLNKYSLDPVNIHISEGAFDILSVYYNLNKSNSVNNIYIANGGKSYYQALKFILEEFVLFNFNVHIYLDKDVSDNEINRLLLNKISDLPCHVYAHRNMYDGEKDYGVPLDKIIDNITQIK